MDLVEDVYKLTNKLPKDELYSLSNQLRRAAVSIPSNIAEGHDRNSLRQYINFLMIAISSNSELQTQLEICVRIGYLTRAEVKPVFLLSQEITKILRSTVASLKKKQTADS